MMIANQRKTCSDSRALVSGKKVQESAEFLHSFPHARYSDAGGGVALKATALITYFQT